jgi:hypothetical protein
LRSCRIQRYNEFTRKELEETGWHAAQKIKLCVPPHGAFLKYECKSRRSADAE